MVSMKALGIVGLVLLLLLVGLPVALGMSMDGDAAHCPACNNPDGPVALAMCLAILALFALIVPMSRRLVSLPAFVAPGAGALASLYRPPRTV